jgi:hypothetical protein
MAGNACMGDEEGGSGGIDRGAMGIARSGRQPPGGIGGASTGQVRRGARGTGSTHAGRTSLYVWGGGG